MTHDELLAKIDDWFEQSGGVGHMTHMNSCVRSNCDCGLKDDRHKQLHKALRAVVELHKPYGIERYPDLKSYCVHCEHLQSQVWPCQTIKAILSELE